MMDFQDTIQEIFSKLTGDTDTDIKYLNEQMETHKNDENAKEVLRAIGRKLYEILPDKKKKEIDSLINNHTDGIDAVVDEAMFELKQNNNAIKAEKMLSTVIDKISDMFQPDDECCYYSFNNSLEEIIFCETEHPTKAVRHATYDFAKIYYLYGYCLIENKKLDEAEFILKEAIRWNPVSTTAMFELAEIYKVKKQFEQYLHWTNVALSFATSAKDIARCYRNLGFYYSDVEEYDTARALYIFSKFFDSTEIANSELYYIAQNTHSAPEKIGVEEISSIFKEKNIQFGGNDKVISIAYALGEHFEKSDKLESAAYCYKAAYELTFNDEIKEKLERLIQRIKDSSN